MKPQVPSLMNGTARQEKDMKRIFAAVVLMLVLAAIPACAQQFPLLGDDNTSSLGSFKIQVTNQFAGMFAGCPGWNNPILTSPTMYDPATKVGRSDALLEWQRR
jgi:hypothetical protein